MWTLFVILHLLVRWALWSAWIYFREVFSRSNTTLNAQWSTSQNKLLGNAEAYFLYNLPISSPIVLLFIILKILILFETTWHITHIWHMLHSLFLWSYCEYLSNFGALLQLKNVCSSSSFEFISKLLSLQLENFGAKHKPQKSKILPRDIQQRRESPCSIV